MGAAANTASKAATKYKESSKSANRKTYEQEQLEGCGPGTFESTQQSKVVRSELEAEQGPNVTNTRNSTYRSKEATSEKANSRAPSVRGDGDSPRRQDSKVSGRPSVMKDDQPTEADRAGSKRTTESRSGTKRQPGEQGSLLEPMQEQPKRSESKRTTVTGDNRMNSKASRGDQQGLPPINKANKLEIVEAQGTAAMDEIEASAQVARNKQRSSTIGLHQAHSDKRQSVLAARGGGASSDDPMGGLTVGMKVIGQGKVGQEMGIGTVVKAGNTPGMVLIRMEASGKEMALPVSKLQKLNDDKMVKAAEKLVKRVPNRDNARRATFA